MTRRTFFEVDDSLNDDTRDLQLFLAAKASTFQVHSFDLMLELLVVNRTNETLQNVLVELSTQVEAK